MLFSMCLGFICIFTVYFCFLLLLLINQTCFYQHTHDRKTKQKSLVDQKTINRRPILPAPINPCLQKFWPWFKPTWPFLQKQGKAGPCAPLICGCHDGQHEKTCGVKTKPALKNVCYVWCSCFFLFRNFRFMFSRLLVCSIFPPIGIVQPCLLSARPCHMSFFLASWRTLPLGEPCHMANLATCPIAFTSSSLVRKFTYWADFDGIRYLHCIEQGILLKADWKLAELSGWMKFLIKLRIFD